MSDQPEPPSEPEPEGGGDSKRQVRLHVSDDLKYGTYSNFLVVTHSAHEFTLDFCQLMRGDDTGQVRADVVSRVRVPPTLVGKVIRALNTNMTVYEDKYGNVKEIG